MKNKWIYLVMIAITASLVVSVNLFSRENNMKLTGAGYIEIGGGCEDSRTAKIFFRPRGDDLQVEVDNSGLYFARFLPAEESRIFVFTSREVEPFFVRLGTLLSAPQPEKIYGSTRNAKVKIFLPFQAGTLEKQWVEEDQTCFMDPLLRLIDEFIQDIGDGKIDSPNISISEKKAHYGEKTKYSEDLIIEYEDFSLQYLYPFRDLEANRNRYFFLVKATNEQKLILWKREAADWDRISKTAFIIGDKHFELALTNPDKDEEKELIVAMAERQSVSVEKKPAIHEIFFFIIRRILQAGSLAEVKALFKENFLHEEAGRFKRFTKSDDPIFDQVGIHTVAEESYFQVFLKLKNDVNINLDDAVTSFGKHERVPPSPEAIKPHALTEGFAIDHSTQIHFQADKKDRRISDVMIFKLFKPLN